MKFTTLESIQKALLSGDLLLIDLIKDYLRKAESIRSYNAFVELYEDELLENARELAIKIRERPHELGRLFGAVVSIKDNLCFKGHKVSAASKVLKDYISPFSATVVERLLEEDALIIGRTNCDEFSMGSTGKNSFYGAVKNAIDPDCISGGSSSGAAVACQLDSCLISIGSDTGGSVRQPASYNGVIGFKPSYGMISRYGLIAYASSLDQIGLIGKNMEDLTLVMSCISGEDGMDSTAAEINPAVFEDARIAVQPRIGRFSNFFSQDNLGPKVLNASNDYFRLLESDGYEIDDIEIDFADLLVPCYYILCAAEASSNLGRYDGIRYGYRSSKHAEDYREMIKNNRTEAFGKEVKKRIILGNYVLSEGYKDAYFSKALEIRKMIRNEMQKLFSKYDYIFLPVTSTTAWNSSVGPEDEMHVYKGDIFTILANLAELPSVSVPIKNKYSKMPLGIQIIAKRLEDPSLLAFAESLKR